jgi:hypothetical protein
MNKILLAAVLLSSPVFADNSGVTVISEKLTCSPGFKCGIENLSSSLKKTLSATARASAPNRSGLVNDYNQIDGYHDISIVNSTKSSQSYEYTYTLQCESANLTYSKWVNLAPGATYTTSDHSYGTVQKASTGSYRITAETKVAGESSASDRNSGTLSVHK